MSDRPLRVLTVVPRGLHGRGGIETLFNYVKDELARRPHAEMTMDFVTSRGDAPDWKWVFRFPLGVAEFVWKLWTTPVDVVHLNVATNASTWRKTLLLALARLHGKPVVAHLHGSAFPKGDAPRGAWVGLLRRFFLKVDDVVVLGPLWSRFLAEYYGLPETMFRVVANGVPDIARGAPPARDPARPLTFVFAGNLTPAKGADLLVEAFAELPRDGRPWRAVVAGSGDVDGFRARAEALGLADRVTFTGWLEQAAIKPLYLEADVVVLPSKGEVLPVCLVEGAAAGAALVATPVGSVPDVVRDGENGRLVPVGDKAALVTALAECLADPERLGRWQRAARATYEGGFTVGQMVDGLLASYRAAIARHRAPKDARAVGRADPARP